MATYYYSDITISSADAGLLDEILKKLQEIGLEECELRRPPVRNSVGISVLEVLANGYGGCDDIAEVLLQESREGVTATMFSHTTDGYCHTELRSFVEGREKTIYRGNLYFEDAETCVVVAAAQRGDVVAKDGVAAIFAGRSPFHDSFDEMADLYALACVIDDLDINPKPECAEGWLGKVAVIDECSQDGDGFNPFESDADLVQKIKSRAEAVLLKARVGERGKPGK